MKTTLVAAAVLLVAPAIAEVPPRSAIDMMVKMAQQNEDFYETAVCLDVPKKTFLDSYRGAVDACYASGEVRRATDFMTAFGACIEPHMLRTLDRTQTQVEVCRSPEDKLMAQAEKLERHAGSLRRSYRSLTEKGELSAADERQLAVLERQLAKLEQQQHALEDELAAFNRDEYDREVDAIMDAAGGGELSAAQRRRIMALSEAKMDRQQQQLAEMMAKVSRASQGTEDQVTLPVYANSKIMMHALDPSIMGQAGQLPAATFASPDTVEKVLAFYRQQLPNFEYKELPGGEHILMESMPPGFAILSHMEAYYTTPHVLIRADRGQPGLTPENTRSFIEIAYRR
ncbi:hypothetical protein FKG94_19400 [Exilibacterium tricleocarpae]|uniref:Uncharacterized protein n=1 Tax=Exilibacterium tricleocarpae TaxID=2591008 RepID=A0A545T3L4_9GAMM|nr:hypothetical protein [Exilibacterium tricleocarpae]TQV71811.1 hypothetical protein FKG94_19400 [Exilibacterium tricleocarpae]